MEQAIADWLQALGLERYAEAFIAEDIDLKSLPLLTDADLQGLGVTLGHRRLILAELAKARRRDPATAATAVEIASAVQASIAAASPSSAERRLVSVLFCDMVGSTEIARKLDPEDMRLLLRSYQDRVAGVVARYGGHLAQYLGDGVMAFFGWPRAFEDQAERAVRAGLEAIEAIRAIEDRSVGRIYSRIAVATGEVVVGDLSEAGRLEGAIAGETPNLAARLQKCAEPDQLLISDATRQLIGDVFDTISHDVHDLEGFAPGVGAHRILGVRDSESRFDATRTGRLTRFVGRQSELALVLEKWELARNGEGQAVLISGEAGIGKSRLVRAVREQAANGPHEHWQLQCSPYHSSSALFPVIQSLSRVLRIAMNDGPPDRIDKLERFLRRGGRDVAPAMPVLADLLSLDLAGGYEKPTGTPQEIKDLTLRTLVDLCIAMSQSSPLLLIIEDVHWIDPTSRELVEQTIAAIAGARVLVLLTHRPDWTAEWTSQFDHVAALAIGRLAQSQISELVHDLVGPTATDELVAEIAARTGGVPMFIEEVARSIVEAGAGGTSSKLQVPTTLQGALMARLDALPPLARELAQIASVMGREFHADILAAVCKRPASAIEPAIGSLLRSRLVARSGLQREAFVFRHALIQDVAYTSMLRPRRQQLHHDIAAALMRLSPEIAEAQPETLAHHSSEARNPEQALPLWHRAGNRALARYANDEAIQHFERACETASQLTDGSERARAALDAEIALAKAQLIAGRTLDAKETFKRAAGRARERGDRQAMIACALGFDEAQFLSNEPLNEAVDGLNGALEVLADGDSTERCQIMCRLTRAHALLSQPDRADHYGRLTIDMARRLGDDRLLTEVMVHGLLMPSGGLSRAMMSARLAQSDEFLRQVRASGDTKLVGRTIGQQIYQAAEFAERDRMDNGIQDLATWSAERNDLHLQWVARHGRAMQAILDGDFARAEALTEEALGMGRRVHDEQVDGVYGMQMFTIRREQGRLAEIAPFIKRLTVADSGKSTWRPGFALVACELGFLEPARKMFEAMAEAGFEFPPDGKRSTTLAYLAEVCVMLADAPRAGALMTALEPYRHMTITTGVVTVCYGAAGRYLGLLAGMLGDWQRAEEYFEAAIEINRRVRARPWLAHAQADLAAMLARRGNPRDGNRIEGLTREAWTTARALDMTGLLRRLKPAQQ